jgi:DDE superfamily endonuclease
LRKISVVGKAFNASIWWSKKWARKHNLHSVGHREAAKGTEESLFVYLLDQELGLSHLVLPCFIRVVAAAALSSQVPLIRKTYSREHIFFVVDTMLFYKVLPTRSFVECDEPRKYLDSLNGRLSLFICSNSSGTHKIPLTMISTSKEPPSFVGKRQKLFPYMYQENAWANPKSLLAWWKDVFLPDIRDWTDQKVLLVFQKPSIVDLDDPQEQVSVRFLPPLLANNHNSTADGLSISSFFETPMKLLSVVKTKYRYCLLKEVFQVFEERHHRREVAKAANFPNPGLKQGHLPHLQDCMRILHDVWNDLPPSAIGSVDEEDGRKRKKRRKRKKKGTTDDDIIENDSMVFTDEVGTDLIIKEIVHFFRKNDDEFRHLSIDDPDINGLDKSVAEVKRCFVNDKLLLQSNEDQLRKILSNWIGLEECQEIRGMLQTEILAGMKFRLIIGMDKDDDEDEDQQSSAIVAKGDVSEVVNDQVALDCATQLLQCAVRLLKEHPVFHDLSSQLVEASDAVFVALRLAKLPPELREKKEPPIPKKRKPRTTYGPRKKRVKIAGPEENAEGEEAKESIDGPVDDGDTLVEAEDGKKPPDGTEPFDTSAKEDRTKKNTDDYGGLIFAI